MYPAHIVEAHQGSGAYIYPRLSPNYLKPLIDQMPGHCERSEAIHVAFRSMTYGLLRRSAPRNDAFDQRFLKVHRCLNRVGTTRDEGLEQHENARVQETEFCFDVVRRNGDKCGVVQKSPYESA
jgi:hypothetical protein